MGSVNSLLYGEEIEVPDDIKEILIPGERVLHAVKQARVRQIVTPDSIFVTTERVIIRRPIILGMRDTKDFRYADMANVHVYKGILNSTVRVKMRFMSDDLVLRGIPPKKAREISKAIQAGLDGRYETAQETTKTATTEAKSNEDLLKLIKKRYFGGEITREEYEHMKRELRH